MITKAELREELKYTQERLEAFRKFVSEQEATIKDCVFLGSNPNGEPLIELKKDPDGFLRLCKLTLIGFHIKGGTL